MPSQHQALRLSEGSSGQDVSFLAGEQFPEGQGQFRASHGSNTNTTSTWSTGAGVDESRMKWPCSLEAEDILKDPKMLEKHGKT